MYLLITVLLSGCNRDNTSRTYNVMEFGASGNGETIDTRSVNEAIEACSKAGGGTVVFPSGKTFLCGTINLKSSITYVIEKDAVILAAPAGTMAYEVPEENPWNEYQDFGHTYYRNSLFYGDSIADIKFTGEGKIAGKNMSRSQVPPGDGNKTFAIKRSRNLTFENISIDQGGWFAFLLNGCNGIIIDNVKIQTPRDGIDLMSCSNVLIKNCEIRALRYDENGVLAGGDDAIGIKSDFALGRKIDSENIIIENCLLSSSCNGVQFGSETVGNFRNILVKDCVIEHADKAGLGITSNDGAIIEDVTYRNIQMTKTANPVFMLISGRGRSPEKPAPGKIRNITFENITATDCYGYIKDRVFTSTLSGLPGFTIDDVTFKNVSITYKGGGTWADSEIDPPYTDEYSPRSLGKRPASAFYIRNARNITFDNFTVSFEKPDYRPSFVLDNVTGCSIINCNITRYPGVMADIISKSSSGLVITPRDSFTILNK